MKRLTDRKKRRLLREARQFLEPFGIDLSLYDDGTVTSDEDDEQSYTIRTAVMYARRDDPNVRIVIDEVWWHPDTGAVLQVRRPYLDDCRY
jgi:hypothetical protein